MLEWPAQAAPGYEEGAEADDSEGDEADDALTEDPMQGRQRAGGGPHAGTPPVHHHGCNGP